MVTVTVDDIRRFAERVERLCDYILKDLAKDGSEDVVVVQELKDDAADIQLIKMDSIRWVDGLSKHMKGM